MQAVEEGQMQEQKVETKRRSIASFILWGAAGFGIGGAIGGAIWPSIGQPYLGFVLMGAIGGASLGLALKDWRRAFISGVAGAIGFGAGSYLNILFSILGGSLGVSLGLALNDWRRAGLLVPTGMIGFMIAIFNTWNMSSGGGTLVSHNVSRLGCRWGCWIRNSSGIPGEEESWLE